jgi:monoamine oxidase
MLREPLVARRRRDTENGIARISRRAFVRGAVAVGAGMAAGLPLGRSAQAQQLRLRRGSRTDVVVIGAGLAGLMAARTLAAAGVDVLVVEARDRVGGRTLNHALPDGKVIEVGGQWVGPLPGQPGAGGFPPTPQARIYQLAQEVGVGTFKTYNDGDYLDYNSGQLIRYTGRIPPDPGTFNAGYAQTQLDMMAMQVPIDAPYQAASALDWDAQSFETWMRENLVPPSQSPTAATNSLVNLAIEAVWAAEPRDVSLLHVLFYIASAGSLENLINTAGGAQDSRFIGGSQQISINMAQELGLRVALNSPVRSIVHTTDGYIQAKGDRARGSGFTVTAKRAIIALPPHLAGRLTYSPSLASISADGGLREQLTQRLPMGTVIKVQCIYPTPFWRAAGLAGQVTSDTGPVKVTFDNSPYPDSSPGVLMGFIEGEEGRVWGQKSQAERRQGVIDSFVRYFGAQAANPTDYVEMVWAAEAYTGGCYGAFFPTGVWTSFGAALRPNVGLIHWAGTETATQWMGYMDGAVESGQRAAAEVLALL